MCHFEDVLEIDKPAPDSHYRLRDCLCGSSQVVYAKYIHTTGAELWRVVCTDCGAAVDLQTPVKHTVQVEWNRRNNHGEIDSEKWRLCDVPGPPPQIPRIQ